MVISESLHFRLREKGEALRWTSERLFRRFN